MKGTLMSCLPSSGSSTSCGVMMPHSAGGDSRAANKVRMQVGVCRTCSIQQRRVVGLFFTGSNRSRNAGLRVEAGWLFRGNDGREMDAGCERSESANEDILVFFFQLDLATRIQYALNMEQYEVAQQLREKLAEVEAEINRLQEAKRGSTSPKSEAQDKAISILRLRSDLQKAIESEDYGLAADLRDAIFKLEADSLAASATALAYESTEYAFRLGQKVQHKVFGYRAVICGMDPLCCESKPWMENAQVAKLAKGANQPFYQVLVDVHADPNLLVAYVAEEKLEAFNPQIRANLTILTSPFLFYGMDTAGDLIPIRQLREKYNRPRHEIPVEPEDVEDGKGGSSM